MWEVYSRGLRRLWPGPVTGRYLQGLRLVGLEARVHAVPRTAGGGRGTETVQSALRRAVRVYGLSLLLVDAAGG